MPFTPSPLTLVNDHHFWTQTSGQGVLLLFQLHILLLLALDLASRCVYDGLSSYNDTTVG